MFLEGPETGFAAGLVPEVDGVGDEWGILAGIIKELVEGVFAGGNGGGVGWARVGRLVFDAGCALYVVDSKADNGHCEPVEMEFRHSVRFASQEAVNVICFKFIPEFMFFSCQLIKGCFVSA